MWETYRPFILFRGFWPYVFNLIVLICLTSVPQISYIENLDIYEPDENEYHLLGTYAPGDIIQTKKEGMGRYSMKTILWINLILCSFEIYFNIGLLYRELIQVK